MAPLKIELPPTEPPLTVIGAMDCGDHLLLAADSQVSDGQVTWQQQKLDFLSDRPLAWGFAGAEDIGVDFGRWLRSYTWGTGDDWYAFRDVAAQELARLNGNKRRLVHRARARLGPEDTAILLLAGYIGREPKILEIDDGARPTFLSEGRFTSVGTGKAHAGIAYRTLMAFSKNTFPHAADNMRALMTVAAGLAPQCSPPVRVLRVSSQGVEDLDAPADPPEEDEQKGGQGG